MTRQDSMALIDTALLEVPTSEPTTDTSVIEPHAAPPIDAIAPPPPKMTAEEKAVFDAQKKLLGEQKAAELRQKQIEEQQKSAALKLIDIATREARKTTDAANVKIGAMPTPGSIAFPLILLLLFFFILIQFGGYTRLQWLWMTITGNAYVTEQQAGPLPGAIGGGKPIPAQEIAMAVLNVPANNFSRSGMMEAF